MKSSLLFRAACLGPVLGLICVNLGCGGDNCSAGAGDNGILLASTTAEVEALLGCTTLGGRVDIDGASGNIDIETIVFENLETVEQDLVIRNVGSVLTISLPSLRQVGTDGRFGSGLQVSGSGSLKEVSAPNLVLTGFNEDNIKGGIGIFENPGLVRINFSGLRHTSEIEFKGNGQLAEISFPHLESVGGFAVRDSGVETISLPRLVTTGGLAIEGNPFLESFSAPGATSPSVGFEDNPSLLDIDLSGLTVSSVRINDARLRSLSLSSLTEVSGLQITGTTELKTVSAPELIQVTEGYLELTNHAVLENLDFPKLMEVDDGLRISDNPNLPDCEVLLLFDQVGVDRRQAGTNKGDGCVQ